MLAINCGPGLSLSHSPPHHLPLLLGSLSFCRTSCADVVGGGSSSARGVQV